MFYYQEGSGENIAYRREMGQSAFFLSLEGHPRGLEQMEGG